MKKLSMDQYLHLVDEGEITDILLNAAIKWEDLSVMGIKSSECAVALFERIKKIKLSSGIYAHIIC